MGVFFVFGFERGWLNVDVTVTRRTRCETRSIIPSTTWACCQDESVVSKRRFEKERQVEEGTFSIKWLFLPGFAVLCLLDTMART
jgi:hypothetical protein